jgi:hypothetical protein
MGLAKVLCFNARRLFLKLPKKKETYFPSDFFPRHSMGKGQGRID